MSDERDDPLLGLLTGIVEGLATLAAWIDAMETRAAEHQAQAYEALATIAEIATRRYYASKPTSALPNEVINANVINPIIEQWPHEWTTTFQSSEFKLLNDLKSLSVSEIEAQLRQRATIAEDATIRYSLMMSVPLKHTWPVSIVQTPLLTPANGSYGDGPDRGIDTFKDYEISY